MDLASVNKNAGCSGEMCLFLAAVSPFETQRGLLLTIRSASLRKSYRACRRNANAQHQHVQSVSQSVRHSKVPASEK